eukprot:1624932-Rhodomonas_salina.2
MIVRGNFETSWLQESRRAEHGRWKEKTGGRKADRTRAWKGKGTEEKKRGIHSAGNGEIGGV